MYRGNGSDEGGVGIVFVADQAVVCITLVRLWIAKSMLSSVFSFMFKFISLSTSLINLEWSVNLLISFLDSS